MQSSHDSPSKIGGLERQEQRIQNLYDVDPADETPLPSRREQYSSVDLLALHSHSSRPKAQPIQNTMHVNVCILPYLLPASFCLITCFVKDGIS